MRKITPQMVNGLYTLRVRIRITSSVFFVIYFPFNLFNSVENENSNFKRNVVCDWLDKILSVWEYRRLYEWKRFSKIIWWMFCNNLIFRMKMKWNIFCQLASVYETEFNISLIPVPFFLVSFLNAYYFFKSKVTFYFTLFIINNH